MGQRGRRARWIVLTILLSIVVTPFAHSASAAVTLAPRASAPYGITIANKFGYLNVTNTQQLGNFTDFPNGTILFDLRGYERTQITYSYLTRAFGNGTFDLRFQTSGLRPRVTAALANSIPFTSSNIQVVDYTSNVNGDPTILIFQGLGSQQIFNAAVYASFFFGIIITSIGVLYGVTIFARAWKGLDVITGEHTPKPTLSTIQVTIVAVSVIIGFGIMIIIAVFFGGVLKGIGF